MAALGVASLATVPPAAAAGAGLAPHRATYEMRAAAGFAHKESQVVDGLMIYELSDDCEGYTLTDRTVLVLSQGDGYATTLDGAYSAWESRDGRTFRFVNSLRINGQEVEQVRGVARLDEPGGRGSVDYSSPEEKTVELPPGTYFPVHAGNVSLDRIAGGERQFDYILFDGSDTDGAVFAGDFVIGDREPAPDDLEPKGDAGLIDSPSWRIRTAFFPLADESAPPTSELEASTHGNGVISRFILETRSFGAAGRLTRIEALPASDC